ncbi:hypothetical protein ACHAWF_008508 [Thalassiosira exigua]
MFFRSCVFICHHILLQVKPSHWHSTSRGIHFERCCPPFGSSLPDFYRSNFHEKRNKKLVPSLPSGGDCDDDAVYVLRSHDGILAALRLTSSKNDEQYSFLRSLCVSRGHRGHGLATRLMEESLQNSDARHCFCFASPKLKRFYQRSGFRMISTNERKDMPKWLIQSYESMEARWSSKGLGPLELFVKDNATNANQTQIVLLQHVSELSKETATGWLLDDDMYLDRLRCTEDDNGPLNMHLQRWVWAGRGDSTRIEEKIRKLEKSRSVFLLWTDPAGGELNAGSENAHLLPETYIILDGTWQQAKHMFRRTPSLWKLPRVSLRENVPPSAYVLRGDYGWKEQFSRQGVEGNRLLCTAEVAAAVLERCGETRSATLIRMRLKAFQETFYKDRR